MSIHICAQSAIEFLVTHPYWILGVCIAYLCLYNVISYLFGNQIGNNPFAKDYRSLPEPIVCDAKSRNAVLKQRFKANLVPDNLDVVIVGSGVGGLTAGVLLSRAGLKVLVLEQHDQAGGACHTFLEKGFEFDTGVHYVGNIHDGRPERLVLDQLTCGQLRWSTIDDEYDIVAIGEPSKAKLFKMKSGEERFRQNLIELFPEEKDAIIRYMELIKDAEESYMGIVILKVLPRILARLLIVTGLYRVLLKCYRKGYAERTLQSVLDSLTKNDELKRVLSYMCGDYGVFPKDVPFALHSLIVVHYWNGAYYPIGGPSEIAFHMIRSIEKAGGQVMVQAPVTNILCDEKGRAVGVRVGKNKIEKEIKAKFIISDAGVINTFKSLLPEHVARRSCIYPLINKVGSSYAFISTFIGVEGSSKDLNLPAANVWLYIADDINKTMSEYLDLEAGDIEDVKIPMSFISFPSAKDPESELKFPGKSSILAITLAKWEWFEEWKDEKLGHRGDRYNGIKDKIGRQMWQQCVDLFPQLEGKKVYLEVGTPVSNQYYRGSPRGEMYGLDHKLARFSADVASKLRPDTDIPGLYLTGQDAFSCGVVASMMVGLICASKVLNRNPMTDLNNIMKDVKYTGSITKYDDIAKKKQ